MLNSKSFLSFAVLALVCSVALAADPAVKKSDSGICHEKSSTSYSNTKKFTAFATLDECVKSGGKLPAGLRNSFLTFNRGGPKDVLLESIISEVIKVQ